MNDFLSKIAQKIVQAPILRFAGHRAGYKYLGDWSCTLSWLKFFLSPPLYYIIWNLRKILLQPESTNPPPPGPQKSECVIENITFLLSY